MNDAKVLGPFLTKPITKLSDLKKILYLDEAGKKIDISIDFFKYFTKVYEPINLFLFPYPADIELKEKSASSKEAEIREYLRKEGYYPTGMQYFLGFCQKKVTEIKKATIHSLNTIGGDEDYSEDTYSEVANCEDGNVVIRPVETTFDFILKKGDFILVQKR